MKAPVVALALAVGLAPSALGTQAGIQGPDLSGRWTQIGASGAGTSRWGPRIEIVQSGPDVRIQPTPGRAERLRLDGAESAEVLTVDGCSNTARITRTVSSPQRVTVTTWLVTKANCFHGEDEDDPLVGRTGAIVPSSIRGPRRLESITVLYRDGDALIVETTGAGSGGEATTTTTTYRK